MTIGIVVLIGLAVLAGIYLVLRRAGARDQEDDDAGRGEGAGEA